MPLTGYNPRQAAAQGRLGSFLTQEEQDEMDYQEAVRSHSSKSKIGTFGGALVGGYFGQPLLGSQLGGSLLAGAAPQRKGKAAAPAKKTDGMDITKLLKLFGGDKKKYGADGELLGEILEPPEALDEDQIADLVRAAYQAEGY